MTLLEKIKNYKWFDSPNKLRTILEELYNSIGGGSGGGGGDLQSILNNGNQSTNQEILLIGTQIVGINGDRSKSLVFDAQDGAIIFNNLDGGNTIGQVILRANNVTNSFYDLNFPNKPTGTYTLATLDDILKINLDNRVYANNAAAITGGLTAKDLYRTSTGELRIVV